MKRENKEIKVEPYEEYYNAGALIQCPVCNEIYLYPQCKGMKNCGICGQTIRIME